MTETRRALAFSRAEERALVGSVVDQPASPAVIFEMAAEAGLPDVKIQVHYHVKRPVAAARPESRSLHFSPTALTVRHALHEIAHLIAGAKAQHGERFVLAFVWLVTHVAGDELAETFQRILKDEGAGLWDLPPRLSVA